MFTIHGSWVFFKLKAQLALPIDSAVCRTACNVLSVATEAESRRKRGSKKKKWRCRYTEGGVLAIRKIVDSAKSLSNKTSRNIKKKKKKNGFQVQRK